MPRHRGTFAYCALLVAGSVALSTREPASRSAWLLWASTNLDNLQHRPVVVLIGSAFLPEDHAVLWVALALIGLGAVEPVLGTARTALLAAAGHLLGTAVGEGLVGVRVHGGQLPERARHVVDVGPSFVVVTGLLAAVLIGRCGARVAAGGAFAILAPSLFDGISHLDVAAVGHVCAVVVGAAGGRWLRPRGTAGNAVDRPGPRGWRPPGQV